MKRDRESTDLPGAAKLAEEETASVLPAGVIERLVQSQVRGYIWHSTQAQQIGSLSFGLRQAQAQSADGGVSEQIRRLRQPINDPRRYLPKRHGGLR